MRTSRSHSAAPPADRAVKDENTRWSASGAFPPQIPRRWRWHYEALSRLRNRLIKVRGEALREAAEPVERHSLHQADSATDEFDHEFALSQLSAQQDALYEVEAAMRRILDNSYGVCEQTAKRIPAARLKAVPWTRFLEEVQARMESSGGITLRHLGTLRSVRDEPAVAFAESEPTVEEPESGSTSEQSTEDDAHD
ncbi:MAG: TraR/DksA C4-type zinc finger protein [Terrimicrobiaceae bacterium]